MVENDTPRRSAAEKTRWAIRSDRVRVVGEELPVARSLAKTFDLTTEPCTVFGSELNDVGEERAMTFVRSCTLCAPRTRGYLAWALASCS